MTLKAGGRSVTPVRISRRVLTTCGLLYLVSQLLFLINIQFPRGQNFDEFHYVPSAKQHLEMKENQNYEHPPLGKELMAIGIAIGGDRPFGWRVMSTIFGALTLVGMYLWAFAVFRDEKLALWAALLTLFNQLLYVQARIGMLDTFMFAFLVYALAAFCATWSPMPAATTRKLLYFSGAMIGLTVACKWFGIIPWALFVFLVITVQVLRGWGTTFARPTALDWFRQDLWQGIRLIDWVLALLVIPLFFYYLTFIPFLFQSGVKRGLWDILVVMQQKMWDGQSRVVSSHPYMSHWLDWATLKRPIWYAFDKEGEKQELVRGVLLLGNPLIMWSGLVAMVSCLWGWLVERRRDAFLIVAIYFALYFSWALIPRKVSFYYYYYPAGMTLSLALAYVFARAEEAAEKKWLRWVFLTAALGVFIYFFPILSALKINGDKFRQWMWFTSWI